MTNTPVLAKGAMSVHYLWIFTFCFTTVASLMFQKFLLPLLPSIHSGSGLLAQDAIIYHQSAMTIAENIRSHGWSAWSVYSALTQTSGNVAVLAALYTIFTVDPALIIPVNAFFQATSACVILMIGRKLWPGRAGNIAGWLTAVLFATFPSSLSWYSQPLKDSYVICGMLLILYSWLKALHLATAKEGMRILFAWMLPGIVLIAMVKLYYLKLLLVVAGLVFCVVAVHEFKNNTLQRYRVALFFVAALLLVATTFAIVRPYAIVETGDNYANWIPAKDSTAKDSTVQSWRWNVTPWLPETLDKYLEIVAKTRAGMIEDNQRVGANTGIDWDRAPQSAVDVFKYLPRALQIALFAPFPDTWLQKPGLTRLAGVGETALWYCIAPGLLLAMAYRRTLALTVTMMFAVVFMAVFGFVTPNVGTLYRYRYAYEFILMVVAIGGWATFILKRYGSSDKARLRPEPTPDISLPLGEDEVSAPGAMKRKLLGAAAAVSTLTLIGSLGLFARDLLMVHWLGAGSEMDSFILGIMIPMFFVSVLSIPAGAALVPVFSALRNTGEPKALASAVSMIALMISALLAVVVILLYFSAPYLLTLLGVQYSHESLTAIREIMNIYLLILLLSGLVVNANAVLNTVGATVFPALAQLIVPVMVLLALLMFGAAYGVYAAAYGMLAGQIANLLLLVYGLWKWKILPALKYHPTFTPDKFPFHQYSILASTALLTALLSPLANALAANLQTGSVAVIGLGTKVVLLLTGAIGMGMTAVLLPYFSGLAAKFHHQQARSDLSFFLLLVTLLSVPLALLLTVLADPVTRMVFANSALTEDNIQSLVRVIQYGVVQLPFFTCGLVATRYITAYQRTGVILLSSLAGLVVALALGIFFMQHIGVGGIALGMTLAMAVSAMILVAHANYLKHLPVTDSIFIVFNWVVFLTLFICLHYGLYVGAAISGGAYVLLVAGNWRAIVADSYSSRPRFLRRPG